MVLIDQITSSSVHMKRQKRILHRTNNISLKDIAALDGYYMFDEHNAYADVWGTLHALCYLTKETTK